MIFFIKSVEYTKQILLQTFYIQVCYMLASQETVDREFGNLQMIKDSHPKYVVSLDRMYGDTNIDGIRHLHLREFLKSKSL